jgi:hypothetical protein
MKHINEIAINILTNEYNDYPRNEQHYDREYRMLLTAILATAISESEPKQKPIDVPQSATMPPNSILTPVVKRMCKYCKKYSPTDRTNNGFNANSAFNLQGECKRKDKAVWKDDYCSVHDYNGR